MKRNLLVKIKYSLILTLLLQCIFFYASSISVKAATKDYRPNLEVDLPGIDEFTPVEIKEGEKTEVPWIGEYLEGLYKYLLSIIGILAATVIVIAGAIRAKSSGDSGEINESNAWVIAAISGVIIALMGVMLFNLINPDIGLKSIDVLVLKKPPPRGCCKIGASCEQLNNAECNSKGGSWQQENLCVNKECKVLSENDRVCYDPQKNPGEIKNMACSTTLMPVGYCAHVTGFKYTCKCKGFGETCGEKEKCCAESKCVSNVCTPYTPGICETRGLYYPCVTGNGISGYCDEEKECHVCQNHGDCDDDRQCCHGNQVIGSCSCGQ